MDESAIRQLADGIIREALKLYYRVQTHMVDSGRHRLSSQSFGALYRVYVADDKRMTMAELATAMQISRPQLTKIINGLEEDELVERTREKRDRRSVYVAATAEGVSCIEQALKSGVDGLTEHLRQLPDERLEQLNEGIDKLRGDK